MASLNRSLTLTWLGQAAFLLEAPATGERLLLDPFLSSRPDRRYPPPISVSSLVDVTAVLATHAHDDHLDMAFLRDLFAVGGRPQVVVPAPLVDSTVAQGIASHRVVGARPGQPLALGSAMVHPVPAYHGVGGDREPVAYGFHSLAGEEGYPFLGYVVELGGVRLYHAGDTLVYPGQEETLKALAPHVLCLPINGRDAYREAQGIVGNMNEDEAARLALAVGAPWVIPMHYEGFANNLGDVGRFCRHFIDQAMVAVLLPARGRPVSLVSSPGGEVGLAARAAANP
jgi:L-ascorbate 6-phosphate lactonase